MAARPNALRTLEYGLRLSKNQIERLNEMIAMAEKVLADNKTLTPDDVAGYKSCISTAKKQLTLFTKIPAIDLPVIKEGPARKRGRPSKSELATLASARGEKSPKKQVQAAAEAPALAPAKKRGRPAKAKTQEATPEAVATPSAPAKRRGRPPKSQVVAAPVVTAADIAPVKKRGRPAKSVVTVSTATVSDDAPVKRGPGRPKGSKNVASLNGQSSEPVILN